ncbi:FGGY-family carbohydrate kinase [Phyllobacterium bourgognense]|uniref:Sugar (Pentulose or hexulose) kinase n=1 Tax=Phyllobacterium bourgognense TaxID=314236 RepID=A0A368YLY8_9HYPH|nr:FGGY-family carbohydrate kinase [Phyllobacterium bourgognense]RCW81251.1 sugar (pentulose or hexulose) kinase [Phyllobacterium bourgognense]
MNRNRAIAVGIDLGTSGVRVAALCEQGNIVGMALSSYGSAEERRRPEAWWRHVRHSLKQLAAEVRLDGIRGIAVDGTSGSLLAVDAAGKALGEASLYNDVCQDTAVLAAVDTHAPIDSAARGHTSPLARALCLQKRGGIAQVVHQADWIAARIVGDGLIVSDENNALKTGFDLDTRSWPEWMERTGFDRSLLPIVYGAGTPIRTVSPNATMVDFPKDAMIFAGTTDGCASFLATGAKQHGEAVTSLGSTLVIKIASHRPIDAPQYGIYSHRVRDMWLAGGASNTGGAVIRSFFADDRLRELSAGVSPDQPTGLDYYPLLEPGERFPVNDPVMAPRLTPRPSDDVKFFQAILEGIAAVEKQGYDRLHELGGPSATSVRTVGGGAKNKAWSRIRQNKMQVPFVESLSAEAAVGTARLVLMGLQNS